MNIVFDKRIGEIFDMLNSLWIINNYEYDIEEEKTSDIARKSKFNF